MKPLMLKLFRKIAFATCLISPSVFASNCLTVDNYVESEGVVCDAGKNMAITSAAEMLIPKDWKMRFLETEVQQQSVAWPRGKLWVDTLDLIGRTSNIGFLVDGNKKMVVALRPNDNIKPGAVVVNSKIARTRQFLGLDELYARVDDTERARREEMARKSTTIIPHSKLNSKRINESRLSYVKVDDAVFVTQVVPGDMETKLREFFLSRWNYRLVVNKHGFYSNPRIKETMSLNGTTVVDDATTLQKLLNVDQEFSFLFNIYNGNKVVELNITCKVCGYE